MDLHGGEFSVGVSLVLGALHALEPGHGKTALVAHLLTEKKQTWKPLILAASTAVTHACSIFVTAMVAHGLLHLALNNQTNADFFFQWLNILSGIILLGTGVFLFRKAARGSRVQLSHRCGCGHHHEGGAHHKGSEQKQNSWRTIAIGFAVGLVPCPSALVALSSAVLAGNWGMAALVIATFSFGIFAALAIVGAFLGLKGRSYLERMSFLETNPNLAFQIQGGVIFATGLWHVWTGAVVG